MKNDILNIIEKWAGAVRAKDMPGILAHHSKDILLFDVPFPIVQSKGIEEYQKTWEMFFDWNGDRAFFELSDIDITAAETLAFCTALVKCGGTDSNGQFEQLNVRLTMCFQKQKGEWMIVHEHHSEPSK